MIRYGISPDLHSSLRTEDQTLHFIISDHVPGFSGRGRFLPFTVSCVRQICHWQAILAKICIFPQLYEQPDGYCQSSASQLREKMRVTGISGHPQTLQIFCTGDHTPMSQRVRLFSDCRNARKDFPFEVFEHCAAAGRHITYFLGVAHLCHCCH